MLRNAMPLERMSISRRRKRMAKGSKGQTAAGG